MGHMYAVGEGVPQDYAEAAKWYRLAVIRNSRTTNPPPAVTVGPHLSLPYDQDARGDRLRKRDTPTEDSRGRPMVHRTRMTT